MKKTAGAEGVVTPSRTSLSNPPLDVVFRGVAVMRGRDTPILKKVLDHTVTAREIIQEYFPHAVGVFWAHAPEWDITGSMAQASLEISGSWVSKYYEEGDGLDGTGFAVVFIAKRPASGFDMHESDWHWGERDSGIPFDLIEVGYNDGTGWRFLPAGGLRVTSGRDGDTPADLTVRRLPPDQVKAISFFEGIAPPAHGVEALSGGQSVGWLVWYGQGHATRQHGEIANVYVTPAMRRRGIATRMLAEARKIEPKVQHSDVLSQDGRAWSQRVGGANGPLPADVQVFAVGNEAWARVGGVLVAHMSWSPSTMEIETLAVDESYRRRGIASAMLAKAREKGYVVQHSPTRTDDGDAFARSFGDAPPRNGERPRARFNGARTAMPSWRDRGAHPDADAFIAPDVMGRRRLFAVWLYDEMVARETSLAAAKAYVEAIYGSLTWKRVKGDQDKHWDPVHGDTVEFNDASVYYVVERLPRLAPSVAALSTTDYEGTTGDRTHITRVQEGTISPRAIANLLGVRGERPGQHRNRQGADWDAFVADVKAHGVRSPIFITVDPDAEPVISEGNHRRDAALEAGLTEVPVTVRYYGHAERQHALASRMAAASAQATYDFENALRGHGVGRSWGDLGPFADFLREVLTKEGVPFGDEAYVWNSEHPTRSSFRGYSSEGIPRFYIGAMTRLDEMLALHEAAHCVLRQVQANSLDEAHDQRWADTYDRLVRQYGSAALQSAWAQRPTAIKTAAGPMLDLYHRTTPDAAAAIYRERKMVSRENTGEAYFSTKRSGQAEGYGGAVVHVRVPESVAELDDEFPDGEQHYRVRVRDIRPEWFIVDSTTAGARGALPKNLRIVPNPQGNGVIAYLPEKDLREIGEYAEDVETEVGRLDWTRDGKVDWVYVGWQELLRRGVATAMWEAAKKIEPRLHHSETRSPTGDGFARATEWATRGPKTAGARGSLPTGLRLEVKPNRRGVLAWLPDRDVQEVKPWAKGEDIVVGELNWDGQGQVSWVAVPYEELQRRGIATALWDLAKTVEPRLHHSTERSQSGDAWSKTTASLQVESAITWRRENGGYLGTGEHGTYQIDGNGFGRMRWTVRYSDDEEDYGMTDTLGEAKEWAESEERQRARRKASLQSTADADTETGVMVCLVPPLDLSDQLLTAKPMPENREPLDEQHVTLVYLGKTKDVDIDVLREAVEAWAEVSEPITGWVSGYGTFENPGENVLYAAWNFDGGEGWRQGLVDALGEVGIVSPSEFDWTPHQTMAYTDEPVTEKPHIRALPDVIFTSVWVVVGPDWVEYPLLGHSA